MNKDTAIKELRIIQQSNDVEMAHIDADRILCDLLISLGYEDVVDEYEAINKWFA